MSGSPPDQRMHYFRLLSFDEQRNAIVRLSRSGFSEHGIAAATALSVEMVRKILGELTEIET